MKPVLDIENIAIDFATEQGSVTAVTEASFQLYPGEVLGIVGESGSGKTQLMHGLLGLLPDNASISGTVKYLDKDLLSASNKEMNQIRSNEIAMIFQDPMASLNPYLRISTQLIEALRINQDMTKAEALEKAIAMLNKVRIPEAKTRIHHYPYQFSGGMRQRIMIAMALLRNPKVLIADEPTTALDVTVQAQILALLKMLRDEFSLSIILITHDMSIVAGQCDRVITMYSGRAVEYASIEKLFYEPKHPYTQGLLAAAKSQSGLTDELVSIPGNPPRGGENIKGCAFYPRCEQRLPVCEQITPVMQGSEEQQQACHLYE
ncbi:MAG: ABC transporter ATP-binding protein [Thioalkalispiraceae bacterium]|jgi:oligopeptide transport system ATP-binding protein